MTQLDTALANIGLASIADDLHAPLQKTQWIVSGYLLGLVVGLPLCGWISGRIGAGRLWCWALAAFTVASVLCAWSPNIQFLIASRVGQGFAGGLLLPAGQTVIAQVAGRKLMGRVMSVVGTPLVLGPAVGPTLGGFLISHASWHWLFLMNLPVGVLGWWLGWRIIPRGEPSTSVPFDTLGFVLIGIGLPAITYVVSRSGEHDAVTSASFLGFLVLGCVALVAFVWRSFKISTPLLRIGLFANRVFAAAAASSFFAGAIQIGALVVWALYFQLVRGYDVVDSGLAMVGFALGAAILPIAGRYTDRFGGGPVLLVGAILTTATFIPVALLPESTPLIVWEVCMFAFGIGNALSVVPSSTAAYVSVSQTEVPGAVTQINILLRFGGAVSAPLVVAVLGDQTQARAELVSGFHLAFWCLALFSAVSIVVALFLVLAAQRAATESSAGRR
jgi:EmrB/QacA subfamily drug resistance transporter